MYMVSDRFKVSLFDINFTTFSFCLFFILFIYLFIYLFICFFYLLFSCLCCCFVFESNKTDIETWVEVWENETEKA